MPMRTWSKCKPQVVRGESDPLFLARLSSLRTFGRLPSRVALGSVSSGLETGTVGITWGSLS